MASASCASCDSSPAPSATMSSDDSWPDCQVRRFLPFAEEFSCKLLQSQQSEDKPDSPAPLAGTVAYAEAIRLSGLQIRWHATDKPPARSFSGRQWGSDQHHCFSDGPPLAVRWTLLEIFLGVSSEQHEYWPSTWSLLARNLSCVNLSQKLAATLLVLLQGMQSSARSGMWSTATPCPRHCLPS